MPTLEEILNESLGVSQPMQEKTASAVTETDEIEKLAMEIGLTDVKTEPASLTKEANMSLSSMYSELFPEDAALDKTASEEVATDEQEKLAAAEEALGARAYDYMCARFDTRIEKLAAAAISEGKEPPQQLPNNKAGGNAMIDTKPEVDNELPPEQGQAVVGKEESRGDAQQVKAASEEDISLFNEMYTTGAEKVAAEIADSLDKLAAEAEKEEEEEEKEEKKEDMDEEQEKKAAELGAIIERGVFDGLRKLGSERHGDELAYLYPFMEEKIAAMPASLQKAWASMKGVAAKGADKAKAGAKAVKDFHLGAAKQVASGAKGLAGKGGEGASKAQAAKELGKGLAKFLPAGAAVGGAGYGASRLLKKDEK